MQRNYILSTKIIASIKLVSLSLQNRLFGWCATTNTIFVEDDAKFEDISNER